MNDPVTYSQAQTLYRLGVDTLKFALEGTECLASAAYMVFTRGWKLESSYIPPIAPGRTAMSLAINAPSYNHAIGLLFDTRDQTFRFLDSSFEDTHQNPQRVIAVLKDKLPGYSYVPFACERAILPQKDDSLCTMWSYFLLAKGCNLPDVREYLRQMKRPILVKEFKDFISDLYARLLKNKRLVQLYQRYKRVYLGLSASRLHTSATTLRQEFRTAIDKKEVLDRYSKEAKFLPTINHTYHQMIFLDHMLSGLIYVDTVPVEPLLNIREIPDMVKYVLSYPTGKFMVIKALHEYFGDSAMPPDVKEVYDKYYEKFSFNVDIQLGVGKLLGSTITEKYKRVDTLTVEAFLRSQTVVYIDSTILDQREDILANPVLRDTYLAHLLTDKWHAQQYLYWQLFDYTAPPNPPPVKIPKLDGKELQFFEAMAWKVPDPQVLLRPPRYSTVTTYNLLEVLVELSGRPTISSIRLELAPESILPIIVRRIIPLFSELRLYAMEKGINYLALTPEDVRFAPPLFTIR